ncbi:MAG: XRE family transcriptional regulator, partial [Clostridia bacterium]|nr:XRE family transcriptional regulator [Clostridia bacterium]
RELLELSHAEMAEITGMSVSEYMAMEEGKNDFTFTFIYKCAKRFGVDMVELLDGTSPTLSFYSVVRKGEGMPISRREGFSYLHLAPFFKEKLAEPFWVTAKYSEAEQNAPIKLSYHEGQEIDIIISGSLKVQLEGYTEILRPGDTIYYDSSHGHGMIAIDGTDCEFISVILKKD